MNNPGVDLGATYGFGKILTLGEGLSLLVQPIFAIAGIAVFFYLVFGGFKFLTSGGNKDAVSSARAMITHALIAFVMLMLLFVALRFLPELLFGENSIQIIDTENTVPAPPTSP